LQKQAREDFNYNELLKARPVHFLRKKVAKKEVADKEVAKKEYDGDDEDQQAWPSRSRMTTASSAPLDFPESVIGSSVPFASSICISTRMVYWAT
jgi:hypothetical protein